MHNPDYLRGKDEATEGRHYARLSLKQRIQLISPNLHSSCRLGLHIQ